MGWESSEVIEFGDCFARDESGEILDFRYSLVHVYTGKQKVFSRKKIILQGEDYLFEKTSSSSNEPFITMLQSLNHRLKEAGLTLLVTGLHPDFYMTGLSASDSSGYVNVDVKPKKMMSYLMFDV